MEKLTDKAAADITRAVHKCLLHNIRPFV
jgi:hypothetical protein